MKQPRLTIQADQPPVVGAFGYNIKLKYDYMNLKPDDDVFILIKSKTGDVKQAEVTVIDKDDAIISYLVQEDDFTEEGTYILQIMQEGEGYRTLSPAEVFPVFDSIFIQSS